MNAHPPIKHYALAYTLHSALNAYTKFRELDSIKNIYCVHCLV
jgi:hypothetical protein